MTGPTVDPGQMKLAADAVMGISQGVRDRVTFIRNAVESPGNWTGATRRAVLEQMQIQLPVLTKLSEALGTGSGVLADNMNRFGMEDQTGAADVGKAAGAAAQGGAGAPASTGSISAALQA
jgi:hypothetical protein